MGERKGYRHLRRPKTQLTWCGLPWRARPAKTSAAYEVCPMCARRSER